jgi:hypothetical protein
MLLEYTLYIGPTNRAVFKYFSKKNAFKCYFLSGSVHGVIGVNNFWGIQVEVERLR